MKSQMLNYLTIRTNYQILNKLKSKVTVKLGDLLEETMNQEIKAKVNEEISNQEIRICP